MTETGEDAIIHLEQLGQIVHRDRFSPGEIKKALVESMNAFGHRITTRVRRRRMQDDRDFVAVRLLDCALDALHRQHNSYVIRQITIALSLYGGE